MRCVVVLEEVVKAFFFQETVDEVPVALAVLHAVLAGEVGGADSQLVARQGDLFAALPGLPVRRVKAGAVYSAPKNIP